MERVYIGEFTYTISSTVPKIGMYYVCILSDETDSVVWNLMGLVIYNILKNILL